MRSQFLPTLLFSIFLFFLVLLFFFIFVQPKSIAFWENFALIRLNCRQDSRMAWDGNVFVCAKNPQRIALLFPVPNPVLPDCFGPAVVTAKAL